MLELRDCGRMNKKEVENRTEFSFEKINAAMLTSFSILKLHLSSFNYLNPKVLPKNNPIKHMTLYLRCSLRLSYIEWALVVMIMINNNSSSTQWIVKDIIKRFIHQTFPLYHSWKYFYKHTHILTDSIQ